MTELTETAKSRIPASESEIAAEESPEIFCGADGFRLLIKSESHWNNDIRKPEIEKPKKDSGRKGTDRRIKNGMQR